MKRDIVFVLVFMIFGLCIGAFPIVSISDVFLSYPPQGLATFTEVADLGSATGSILVFLNKHLTLIRIILLILTIIVFALVLDQLNPRFGSVRTGEANKAKLIVMILCCLVMFPLLTFVSTPGPIWYAFEVPFDFSDVFFGISSAELPNLPYGLFLILVVAVLWLIAGETAWAGDFSSWKMDRGGVGLKLVMAFVMGAAVGVIAYYVRHLFSWASQQYFILLSEVLMSSSEITFHGAKLLTYGLMFTLAFSLGIVAGFVTVLAPRQMAVRQRLLRLIVPGVLLAIYFPVVIGTYWYAHIKYDLGESSLAEAVGIPEKGWENKTVVALMPEKPVLQEWPMQAGVLIYRWNFSKKTVELSYENLKKIEEYLRDHKDRTVFYWTGLEVLVNGYNWFWDTERGIKQMSRNAPYAYVPRMQLLVRLRYVPVTSENEKYLRDFADETKWHVGKVGALRLAEAFMHFGHADEAKKWAEKAKAKGEDVSKATFLTEPVFTKGALSGAFKVNGVPLGGAKVALVAYRDKDNWDITKIFTLTVRLNTRLVDVRTTDASGKFTFSNLGRGEYMLAVMTDKETVPYSLPPSQFKVKNAPGMIKLDIKNPSKNVGDINILTK
jgi:hypothetical protein